MLIKNIITCFILFLILKKSNGNCEKSTTELLCEDIKKERALQLRTYELFKVEGIEQDKYIDSSLNYKIRVLETFKKVPEIYPSSKYIVVKEAEKSTITFDVNETYAALFYNFHYYRNGNDSSWDLYGTPRKPRKMTATDNDFCTTWYKEKKELKQ